MVQLGGIYVETILSVNNPQTIPLSKFMTKGTYFGCEIWKRIPNSGMVDEKPKKKDPVQVQNQSLPKKRVHEGTE